MTTWWLLVPLAAFWYLWSLSKAIEKVTGASAGANYVLMLPLGNIGQARIYGKTVTTVATAKPSAA